MACPARLNACPARRCGIALACPLSPYAGSWCVTPSARLSDSPFSAPSPPLQILAWFIWRCCLETTFEQARAQLGLETQRQSSTLAIQPTPPTFIGPFFVHYLVDESFFDRRRLPGAYRRLVCQTCPHLFGCHCPRSPLAAAFCAFFHIPQNATRL